MIERMTVEVLSDAPVVGSVVLRIALECGFERRRAAELALVASELATNIVKYGGGRGELRVALESDALVLTSLDRGHGPPSEAELFGDGISRGQLRTPDQSIVTGRGTGGGALRRLCDEVELGPREGGGTMIRCRKLLASGRGRRPDPRSRAQDCP